VVASTSQVAASLGCSSIVIEQPFQLMAGATMRASTAA
jgi:hypothetical protein